MQNNYREKRKVSSNGVKWCFLVNEAQLLMEFLGKIAHQATQEGDECIVAMHSKVAEYTKRAYFPQNSRFISKVDWAREHWHKDQPVEDISWKQFFSTFDRHRDFSFGYESTVAIVSQLYQFFDELFQKEKPDIILNEPPANMFTEVAYSLARKYGIPYVGIIGSRFDGRIDVYDLRHTNSNYEKDFEKIDLAHISQEERMFAQKFIDTFISHAKLPPYVEYLNSHLASTNSLQRYIRHEKNLLPSLLKYFRQRKSLSAYDFGSEFMFQYNLQYPSIALRRKFRALFQPNFFEPVNEHDTYFLFPLHIQPEASTSTLAAYFSNQLNTAKNIAFALPFPFKLYVREHPSALYHNPTDFYRELRKIPQVVLTSPKEDAAYVIRKSQGVITLTSSLGLEAAFTGKPTYVLGDVFYSHHPVCQNIRDFEELRQAIEKDVKNRPTYPDLENDNIRFVLSYYKNGFSGDAVQASEQQDTNDYKAIYSDLKRLFLKQ